MSYKNFTTHSYKFLRARGLANKDKLYFEPKTLGMNSIDAISGGEASSRTFQRSTSLPGPRKIARIDEADTPNWDEAMRVLITDFDQENYHMSHKFRGVAFLINIEDFAHEGSREGSLADGLRMKKVLQELKFLVIEPESGTRKNIFDEAGKIALMDHSESDCFVLVIMTHGGKNGRLRALKESFNAQTLFDIFMGDNCRTLVGKPKLFFVQACRGLKCDKGIAKFDDIDAKGSTESFIKLPSTADQLIMYSTPEGFVSMRNTVDGSWFIQELCLQLETNIKDDLLTILTRVCRKVAVKEVGHSKNVDLIGAKQMPIIVSSLTKKIFFTATE